MTPEQGTIVLPLSQLDFKSYLIRALLEWCEDEGYTPYMLVAVDDYTKVPREFVNKDNTIVFCVSSEATHNFNIDREGVSFQARFGESAQDIDIPIGRIAAIYPKENTDLVSYFPVKSTEKPVNHSEKSEEDDIPTFTKL